MRIAVRAPDHLGDAVMALPAVNALCSQFDHVAVYTRGRWGAELYGRTATFVGDDLPNADVGVFLKPSVAAAVRWRHLPRRIGVGAKPFLTDALPERAEHRKSRYARIVSVLGVAGPLPVPLYSARGTSHAPAGSFVGLNPWSPTATVRWGEYSALADALSQRGVAVAYFAGPGEVHAVRAIAGEHPVIDGLTLPDFAATLSRCRAFVSNDSGGAHFAAACGAPVVMVHGSTEHHVTGAGVGVDGGQLWCRPCYRKHCFWGTPCLARVSVEAVLAATLGALRE